MESSLILLGLVGDGTSPGGERASSSPGEAEVGVIDLASSSNLSSPSSGEPSSPPSPVTKRNVH